MIGEVLEDYKVESYLEILFSTLDAFISLKELFPENYSPFGNTGPYYIRTPVFTAVGYDWGANDSDNEEDWQPYNFRYKDKLTISWYKHAWRGIEIIDAKEFITRDFMLNMYEDCIRSLMDDRIECGFIYDDDFSY